MGKKGGGVRIKQMGPKGGAGKMPLTNPMEDLMIPPEDMVHLPPKPDNNFQLFWPMHETFSMDVTGFITIYPSYLDATKSIREGRRISSSQAVDTPTVTDISQALQGLGIRHVIQPNKGYSRDTMLLWDNPGRVKLQPPTDNFPTKRKLLVEVASRIKDLPDRKRRLEQAEIAAAKEQEAIEAARLEKQQKNKSKKQITSSSSSKTTTTSGSSKKKGKKKR